MINLKQSETAWVEVLQKAGIENAAADIRLLIGFVLNKTKSQLYSINELSENQFKKIDKLVSRRAKRVPLQHILKTVEFLNLSLNVNKNVLIPRFETELLADIIVKDIKSGNLPCQKADSQTFKNSKSKTDDGQSLENGKGKSENGRGCNESDKITVLDVCAGSGAIGLAIAKETDAQVMLSDIGKKAIRVAKQNAEKNNLQVAFNRGNMFNGINKKFDVIVSNPPYISESDYQTLQPEVKKHDPKLALVGKDDGYEFYKVIASCGKDCLTNNGVIYLEYGQGQEKIIAELLKNNFKNIKIIKDYNNINRFIYAENKGEK